MLRHPFDQFFVKKDHSRPVHSPLHIPSPQHSLLHARRDLKHKEKSKQRAGTAPLCAEGTQDTDAHTYTWLCTHPYTHASTHAQPQELREEVQRREDRTLMPAWALHQHCLHHTALQVMTGCGEEAPYTWETGSWRGKDRQLKPKSWVCLLVSSHRHTWLQEEE